MLMSFEVSFFIWTSSHISSCSVSAPFISNTPLKQFITVENLLLLKLLFFCKWSETYNNKILCSVFFIWFTCSQPKRFTMKMNWRNLRWTICKESSTFTSLQFQLQLSFSLSNLYLFTLKLCSFKLKIPKTLYVKDCRLCCFSIYVSNRIFLQKAKFHFCFKFFFSCK